MSSHSAPHSSLALSLEQQFEIARFEQVIDAIEDLNELRSIAKQLLVSWQGQVAATRWAVHQRMTPLSSYDSPS